MSHVVRNVLFTLALTGAALTTAAPAGASAAAVQECHVVEGQTLCLVPDVTGEGVSQAEKDLRVSGFFLGDVLRVVDPTCVRIGKVVRTDPHAGAVAPRGTSVTVYVGTRPAGPVCP